MSRSLSYDGRLKANAQALRREMTRQEKHLWYDFLKKHVPPFHRQKQFGYYIVVFYCAVGNLVVELDGSQHYEPEGMAHDTARDAYLTGLGLRILRFASIDVDRHFETVCAAIDRAIEETNGQENDLIRHDASRRATFP